MRSPDLQGRLHRTRRDGVGGDDEGAEEDGDDDRDDDDAEQLDDPAVGLPLLRVRTLDLLLPRLELRVGPCSGVGAGSGFRGERRRRFVDGHDRRKYYPVAVPGPVGAGVGQGVTAPGHNGIVTNAVIFDFYGTLAHWADARATTTQAVFAAHGYTLDRDRPRRTTSPVTTGSTMPSTRSARRPTRPGSGRACAS